MSAEDAGTAKHFSAHSVSADGDAEAGTGAGAAGGDNQIEQPGAAQLLLSTAKLATEVKLYRSQVAALAKTSADMAAYLQYFDQQWR